jgi:hypothetical protein
MVLQVNEVLVKHGLNAHVIAFIKDEGGNFSTMTQALASIVSCEKLGVWHIHFGGMLCLKDCQYAIHDSKVCASLTSVSIKEAQSILQKNYYLDPKKWEVLAGLAQTCLHSGVPQESSRLY